MTLLPSNIVHMLHLQFWIYIESQNTMSENRVEIIYI